MWPALAISMRRLPQGLSGLTAVRPRVYCSGYQFSIRTSMPVPSKAF